MKKVILLSLGLIAFLNAEVKKDFYPSGELKSVISLNDKGEKNGSVNIYFKNGSIKEKFVVGSSGSFEGEYRSYYENGKIKESIMFSGGLPNGRYAEFNKDGSLKYKKTYANGEEV